MNYIFQILIFCIVLFLYLHIYHHLKTNNDLEVYELDYPSKETLEELCDIRQPVLFHYDNQYIRDSLQLPTIVEKYGVFDVNQRTEYSDNNDSLTIQHEPIVLHEAMEQCRASQEQAIFEKNQRFLHDTTLEKTMKSYDSFLRPHMVASCKYDIIFGSKSTTTPLQYKLQYRNYYMVTHGSVTMKLIPPNNTKYLHSESDYASYEFRSPINPWNVQSEYKKDFLKVKTLEVTLNEGDTIYIPAYWSYSIRFDELSCIATFSYKTYANILAILPHICMYFLQQSNTKQRIIKDTSESAHEISETDDTVSSNKEK